MRAILFSVFCFMTFTSFHEAHGQDLSPGAYAGDWQGSLDLGESSLRIVFHIQAEDDGTLSATMDSPDQGAAGIPVVRTTVENDELRLDLSNLQASYKGRLNPEEGVIEGTFEQRGMSFPLVLAPQTEETGLNRPQEPKPPFPYAIQDVFFENREAGIELAGTLTVPDSDGPHPAVILISGSGPQDRDGTVLGHKPFLVLADHFSRNGIAVLRYDDRGFGESQGDFVTATTSDFATDAEAALHFLKTRGDVDAGAIGLIGHSEGGLIAPKVAASSSDAAFIVLLAAPGFPGRDIILKQAETLLILGGADRSFANKATEINARLYRQVIDMPDPDMLSVELRQELTDIRSNLSTEEIQRLNVGSERDDDVVRQLASPWMREFLMYDPRPTLQRVPVPVLALMGSNDRQVAALENASAIRKALELGENPDYTVETLPGLNHLFQSSQTGLPSEYGRIEETFNRDALDFITNWIKERV